VNGSSVNLPTSNSYDADGNLGREILPNAVTDTYTYDTLNRLLTNTSSGPTGQVYQDCYTLNAAGQRIADAIWQGEPPTIYPSTPGNLVLDISWNYDNDGRLISADYVADTVDSSNFDADGYAGDYIYTYDLAGNRLSANNTDYTYNHDNELTSQTVTYSATNSYTTNTYDANGSLTQSITTAGSTITTNSYTYDLRNKMVAFATNGTTAANYVYDDAGNRVREITGGVTNYYLTDIQNPTGYAQPIEVWNTAPSARSGQVPQMTYILGTRVLGQFDHTGTVSYYTTDGHGSVVDTTDSSANVQAAFTYDPFGDLIQFTPTSSTPIFLFGGDAVYDWVSGLYMNGDGVRDRNGFIFYQMDTYAGNPNDPMTLHKYLYANADPIIFDDPTGLYPSLIPPWLMGTLVSNYIGKEFEAFADYGFATPPGVFRFGNRAVSTILSKLNFNRQFPYTRPRPDLVEATHTAGSVYEIKQGVAADFEIPGLFKQDAAVASSDVAYYDDLLNKFNTPTVFSPGTTYAPGLVSWPNFSLYSCGRGVGHVLRLRHCTWRHTLGFRGRQLSADIVSGLT
jgi:YD repeat-containing protein